MIDEGTVHINLSIIGAEELGEDDPRQIGAFPLRAVLGAGGMGRVYLGVAPGGYTAVKRVLPELARDKLFLRRFGHELASQARLPAGVSARLLASDQTASPPWFATEYVPGVTLYDGVYGNGGQLPVETVWVLLRELAGRLDQVARLGMTHRDLKPSNVMLTAEGVTLIDFGIARAADQSSVTSAGMLIGTPGYMAPEQVRGRRDLTPAVDVFALGSVLAFAATGEPAFGGDTSGDLFYRILHVDPDLDALQALDPRLADVVTSCLAKDPADRLTAAALAEIAAAHAVPGPPTWPASIAEPIAARRDFAQNAPGIGPDSPEKTGETEFEEADVPTELVPATELAHAETVALVPEPPKPGKPSKPDRLSKSGKPLGTGGRVHRARKALLLLLALLLLAGTTGTLIALHKVPFVNSAGPNTSGGGNPTPSANGSGARQASASAYSSASAASVATGKTKADPSSSGSASSGSGSTTGSSGSTSGSSGNNGGTGTTKTTSAAATHTTSSGGGSGTSYATVVSTTYSEVENVAASVCVSGSSGAGTQSCDGSSNAAFREESVSGGFELVNQNTGLCLYNDESTSGTAYAFSCDVLTPSTVTWHVGTRTARGGELVNGGQCLAYSSTAQGNLTMASCDSSDSKQLWYDGGAA